MARDVTRPKRLQVVSRKNGHGVQRSLPGRPELIFMEGDLP
jgi:hypothetical protein